MTLAISFVAEKGFGLPFRIWNLNSTVIINVKIFIFLAANRAHSRTLAKKRTGRSEF